MSRRRCPSPLDLRTTGERKCSKVIGWLTPQEVKARYFNYKTMWTAADDIRKHTKTLEWESHPTQLYEVLQRSISVGYNLIIQYFQEEEEKKKA